MKTLDKNQIFNNVYNALLNAKKSQGFFFTLTVKNGKTLNHFEQHYNFPSADFEGSLIQIAKILNEQYPDVCQNILDRELISSIVPLTTVTKAEG